MAARGVGFCNGHLSPTRLNSYQKPSHSALPHSRPCTPVCRYTRFAFPSSVPRHNLPAAPHHSRPLPAVLQSPSNRSLLHVPSQRTASAIAARCIGHRTALHRSSHRTAFPRAGHGPLPVSPLSGHGFRPRVWPGSLCPPPPTAPYRQREAAVLSTEHHGLSSPGARPAPRARPIPNPECFISQLARSALEPHCIRIGEAPDACHNCGAQAAPQGGTRSRHAG